MESLWQWAERNFLSVVVWTYGLGFVLLIGLLLV
jgi:hypothetical protein